MKLISYILCKPRKLFRLNKKKFQILAECNFLVTASLDSGRLQIDPDSLRKYSVCLKFQILLFLLLIGVFGNGVGE